MQAPRRHCLCALISLLVVGALAPRARAGNLTITSTPTGATVEIDGAAIGTTPYTVDYPSSYFHKPHTMLSARLEHAMILRIYKDGYSPQQLKLTEGPLQWISVTGRHQGNYFLLKADHFDFKLETVSETRHRSVPPGADGNGTPAGESSGGLVQASVNGEHVSASSVMFTSDPTGAEIYVDGRFVGQTPSTIPMPPGSHVIVMKAAGRKNWERDLNLLKDSQVALHPVLELQP